MSINRYPKKIDNIVKEEDTAHSSGDKGVMNLGVRNDTLASLVDSDGDYAPFQLTGDGSVYISGAKKIDSGNSTTSTLTSGSTFTGTGIDLNGYGGVTVQLFADQDGAANGMRFEFSPDNTNWDVSHRHDYVADTGRTFQFTAHAQYFRLVFVNGGVNQGAIRIQTILHHNPPNTTIHRLDTDEAIDRSAAIVKSILMAQKAGTGVFTAINSTAGGNLKTSVQEISDGLDIGAGNAGAETARVSIATNDVNLSAIKTAVEILDNAIANNEMQVDIVTDQPKDRLVDNQGVALQTDAIMNDTTALTPKFKVLAAAGSPNNTLIAAVAGKKIRVLALFMVSAGTVNVRFESGAGATALTGQMNLVVNSGFTLPFNPVGWFETGSNVLLNLELSAAVSVDGSITYVEV